MHDARVNRQYAPLRPQLEAKGLLVYLAKEAFKCAGKVAIGSGTLPGKTLPCSDKES
jgi:hypothetical protein